MCNAKHDCLHGYTVGTVAEYARSDQHHSFCPVAVSARKLNRILWTQAYKAELRIRQMAKLLEDIETHGEE